MVNVNNGSQRLGILVGGGPAPGINSVISAVTIEAQNSNLEVIGIYAGFAGLIEGNTNDVCRLTIPDVSNIHFQGGSILRTYVISVKCNANFNRRLFPRPWPHD